jgi:hypothetical protein
MSSNKSPLHEVASNADALRTARSEPIQQAPAPRQTMDFIRSLILDIPTQNYVEESTVDPVKTESEPHTTTVDQPDESIDLIKKLAGL